MRVWREREGPGCSHEDPRGWLWGDRPRTFAVRRDASPGEAGGTWRLELRDAREDISGGKGRKAVLDRENTNRSSEPSWKTANRKSSGEKKKGKTMSPVQMQEGTLVQDRIKLIQ